MLEALTWHLTPEPTPVFRLNKNPPMKITLEVPRVPQSIVPLLYRVEARCRPPDNGKVSMSNPVLQLMTAPKSLVKFSVSDHPLYGGVATGSVWKFPLVKLTTNWLDNNSSE